MSDEHILRLLDIRARLQASFSRQSEFEKDCAALDAAIAALGGAEALTEAERMALEGVMANAEHEGYDTDDACPDIDDDEDAYLAWNTYHGLRKLLPAPPSKEG